jgi:glycine cleavage system H protein
MTRHAALERNLKGVLLFASIAALVVLALPLVTAGVLLGRVLATVALALLVVALPFRAVRERLALLLDGGAPWPSYKGIRVPRGLLMHPAHAWARPGAADEVTAGADDLLVRALGPPTGILVGKQFQHVRQGDVLARLFRDGRSVAVRSPVTGLVAELNPALVAEPALAARDPYGDGWIARLDATDLALDRRDLVRERHAAPWFRQEVDRLLQTLGASALPGPAAADGGLVVEDLHAAIDDASWPALKAAMFSDVE